MKFNIAVLTIAALLGLAACCFEKPPQVSNTIYLVSNFTRDIYAFDLSRSTLKDYQKTVEAEIVSHWALRPMKFSLNLLNCGVKTDSFPRRGHVYYNGEWIPMSKPCMRDMMKDCTSRVDPFHHQDAARPMKFGKIAGQRMPTPPRRPSRGIIEIQKRPTRGIIEIQEKPAKGIIEIQEKKQIVMHNEQPKRRQRRHNLKQKFARVHAHLRRWGRKQNNANVPQVDDRKPKFAHRHHAHNHPRHSRHEIRNHHSHGEKPATSISPSYSIHTGFASLIQPNKRAQPMGFTLTYTSEKAVRGKTDGQYTLVAKVNVICQREGIAETGKMNLIDQNINGRIYTATFNYYSYAGCPKNQAPQPTRHDNEDFEIIIAPVFLLVFCCSFCVQVIPIIAIVIAIVIAVKKIQEIRKKNAQIKTNATATVLPQVNVVPVPVPVKQIQPVEQPKKEERKPMQQVGVQVVQQQQPQQPQQIELQQMVLPTFQPQTVQPQVPVQQQPRYAFYPPIQPQYYPQVFVYPQQ